MKVFFSNTLAGKKKKQLAAKIQQMRNLLPPQVRQWPGPGLVGVTDPRRGEKWRNADHLRCGVRTCVFKEADHDAAEEEGKEREDEENEDFKKSMYWSRRGRGKGR